jgi:hypothetical protein
MYVAWGWQQFRPCMLFCSKRNGKLTKELHVSHTLILYNSCIDYVNKNVFKIQAVIVLNKNSLKYEPQENGTYKDLKVLKCNISTFWGAWAWNRVG